MQLVIRHYIHQQAARPTAAAQSQHCPIPHINCYLRVCSSSPGPLFTLTDKVRISGSYFASQLSACVARAGYGPNLYKCHSFRIAVATMDASKGFSEIEIKNRQVEIQCFSQIYPHSYDAVINPPCFCQKSPGAAAVLRA